MKKSDFDKFIDRHKNHPAVYDYIQIELDIEEIHRRPHFQVNMLDNSLIGRIHWYPRWRQWVFAPLPNSIYSADCLSQIMGFTDSLNRR